MEWDKRTQTVVFILIGALIFGAGVKYALTDRISADTEIINAGEEELVQTGEIWIHITGAVENPGVYGFDAGTRVDDAVSKAVASPDADLDGLNLAAALEDGEKLIVPEKRLFTSSESTFSGDSVNGSGKININKASAAELEALPGIGPVYAERIVNYRNDEGVFTQVEELKNIAGIGTKTLENIEELVYVQ